MTACCGSGDCLAPTPQVLQGSALCQSHKRCRVQGQCLRLGIAAFALYAAACLVCLLRAASLLHAPCKHEQAAFMLVPPSALPRNSKQWH
eukprot:1152248-Pelagomonas_calceolata.AAC.3